MPIAPAAALYRGHRYPAEVIAHAVWLYFRFALSYRDVEELLAERGIPVSYETVCAVQVLRHRCLYTDIVSPGQPSPERSGARGTRCG